MAHKDKDLLRAEDLAKFFGLSIKTIYHAAQKGQLPGVRVGRFWFFSKKAIFSFLKTGRRKSPVKFTASVQKRGPLLELMNK